MVNKVPITRLGKFFSQEDFDLDTSVGSEWLYGDLNFTLVLYRIDRMKTKTDNVYGESVSDGIKFLPPVEFKGYVQIEAPSNVDYGSAKLSQTEPGNLKVGVYQKQLEELVKAKADADKLIGEANKKAVEAQDAYTRTDTYDTAEEAPEGATERTRLGIRYPELLAFVGAATEQRLTSIESRLTALEG